MIIGVRPGQIHVNGVNRNLAQGLTRYASWLWWGGSVVTLDDLAHR
jgi:hypothetical protein